MRDPLFILGDRGTGKTVKAITEAESVGGVVVVANGMMKDFTKRLAQEHGLKILEPITHADLLYSDRLKGLRAPVILDDADILFRNFIGSYYDRPLHMVTWSVDHDRVTYLEPRNTSTLEQLREYRKGLPTYETTVPITDLWALEENNRNLRDALAQARLNERQAVTMMGAVLKMNQQGSEDAE